MNVLENFLAGRQARREQDAADQTNAMNGFLQQNGQAIFNGDQNALGQLAGFGVEGLQAAMGAQETRQSMEVRDLGMQQTRQNMAISSEEIQMKRDQVRQQASEALIAQQGKIDAATLEAERAKLEKGLAMGSQAQTPEQWDQAMQMVGQEDYVGQFENRHMIMAGAMGLKDALDTFKPDAPLSPEGKVAADQAAGFLPPATPQFDTKGEDDLRDEFTKLPAVKTFAVQSESYARIAAASQDPSAAGDLALIFSYMKMLDPGSVVREGEFANAQNAAGIPERVAAMYNNVLNGERLTENTRADFLDRADKIYSAAETGYSAIEKQYLGIAGSRKYRPEQSTIDFRYTGERIGKKPPPPPPANSPLPTAPPADGLSADELKYLGR